MKLLIIREKRLGIFCFGLCWKLEHFEDLFPNWTKDFFAGFRILVVQKIQSMRLVLINLGIKSRLWPQLEASILPTRSQLKNVSFFGVLVVINNLFVPFDWFLVVQKIKKYFSIWSLLDFKTQVFPTITNLIPSVRFSLKRILTEVKKMNEKKKKRWFGTSLWIIDIQELPGRIFCVRTLRFSNSYYFKPTYFISSHQGVKLDNFIPEAIRLFQSISKLDY